MTAALQSAGSIANWATGSPIADRYGAHTGPQVYGAHYGPLQVGPEQLWGMPKPCSAWLGQVSAWSALRIGLQITQERNQIIG